MSQKPSTFKDWLTSQTEDWRGAFDRLMQNFESWEQKSPVASAQALAPTPAPTPSPSLAPQPGLPEEYLGSSKPEMGILETLGQGVKDLPRSMGELNQGLEQVPYVGNLVQAHRQNWDARNNLDQGIAEMLMQEGNTPFNIQRGMVNDPSLAPEVQDYLGNQQLNMVAGMSGGLTSKPVNPLANILKNKPGSLTEAWDDVVGMAKPQLPSATTQSALATTKPQSTVGDPLAKFKKKENLVKIDPVLEIKKQITARDIQGNKIELSAGEALTPYELKGNKYLLKDGEEYIVNKNQYQNIKGNAIKAEAKPFAPELEQTRETVRGVTTTAKPLFDVANKSGIEIKLRGQYVEAAFDKETGRNLTIAELEKTHPDVYKAINKYESNLGNIQAGKYSEYTLPGGENYREVLIQAPVERVGSPKYLELANKYEKLTGLPASKIGGGHLKAAGVSEKDVGEWYDVMVPVARGEFGKPQSFTSSHWSEKDVLAWYRANDRTYQNKPVTFIEEIQSDWAGDVRKNPPKKYEVIKNTDRGGFNLVDENGESLSWFADKKMAQQKADELGTHGGTPTNPLLKNWQELAAKRALKDAVDNNSEYLSWTTGEQQAARYDLSRQVDSVEWRPHPAPDRKSIIISPKEAAQIVITVDKNGKVSHATGKANDWLDKNLSDVLGKDIAEKILKNEEGTLKEDGLKIGGEWAKNLYDKQFSKIIEKITGKKVETIKLELPNKKPEWFDMRANPIRDEGDVAKGSLISRDRDAGLHSEQADKWVVTGYSGPTKIRVVQDLTADNEREVYEKILKRFLYSNGDTPSISDISTDLTTEDFKILDKYAEEIDVLPQPKQSPQQAIKLTPEIKALVRGEAPPVKQPSGVNPLLALLGALGIKGMRADDKRGAEQKQSAW